MRHKGTSGERAAGGVRQKWLRTAHCGPVREWVSSARKLCFCAFFTSSRSVRLCCDRGGKSDWLLTVPVEIVRRHQNRNRPRGEGGRRTHNRKMEQKMYRFFHIQFPRCHHP